MKSNKPGRAEIERYFTTIESAAEGVEPLEYWVDLKLTLPLFSKVAVDMLVIPASSTPIERVFSTAGETSIGRRNRLSDSNLEREINLKFSPEYIEIVTTVHCIIVTCNRSYYM